MKRSKSFVFAFILVLMVSLSGCALNPAQQNPSDNNPAVDPKPNQETVSFSVYFADNQAMYLKGEERTVTKSGSVAELMVNELIKGPNSQDSYATIPRETKLLSLEIAGGVAYVNFSKEVQTNYWGGTDLMTVFSVVNTLTQLPEIKKVQFLLEGEKQDAIWGHYYTLEPVEANSSLMAPGVSEPKQPDQTNPAAPTKEEKLTKPGDYFPITKGSTWQFLGDGNEYATFNREVQYMEGNKGQFKEDNGGTVSSSIYQITAEAVTQVYFTGEDYEPKNMLKQAGNRNVIILKAPIKAGTKWTAGNSTREILDVKASVNTPAGKFGDCVKVKITENQSTTYEYYKKGIGLVKREFLLGDDDKISSILSGYTVK